MNFFGKLRSATLRMAFRMALSAIGFCAGWAASIPPALAATSGATDISQAPLVTSISSAVKPNLMYIMDTSGSMAWSFMPDCVGMKANTNVGGTIECPSSQGYTSTGYTPNKCFKNYIFNGVYYNPNYTYALPVHADGTKLPLPSFKSAPYDGFANDQAIQNKTTYSNFVDLSKNFQAWDANNSYSLGTQDTKQPAYYAKYTGTVNATTPNNTTCYADTSYTTVVVSTTSGPGNTDETQNFAIWYSYYRTRIMFVKTAIGIAFNGLSSADMSTSQYRVGFTNIYNSSWKQANSQYLPISDFVSAQKTSFYSTLYTQTATGGTPLQQALYSVGQLYQAKLSNAPDPVQYSCQKNYAILSTDGYWNGSPAFSGVGETDGNPSTVNGVSVNPTPLPYYDGGTGTKDTLADVAYYFWATDLRPTGSKGALNTDVSNNNVHPTPSDPATWQHMDTFTIGLGADGLLTYQGNYDTATSGDYYNILTGAHTGCKAAVTTTNPSTTTCVWPIPAADQPTTIDDLWHAGVNGHGKYFSVKNPGALADGFQQILTTIAATVGTNAAAATSNPNIVQGDNYQFASTFTSNYWYGELIRQTLSVNTGQVVSTDWSAQGQLDTMGAATSDSRTIYMYSSSTATKLTPFLWANMSAAQQAYFQASSLSQYTTFTPAQAAAATGAAMVNYLRGQRGNEIDLSNTTATTSLFRTRQHILGDIIDAEAAYVKVPRFNYGDAGYAAFVAANTNRQGMVYAAANDGMLHAFNSDTGAEMWAYVPSLPMANMSKLADNLYGINHQFFVDGTPVTGDVFIGGVWKTILVGGFNAGGRGYYALDVTSPGNPAALWEFSDTNMGLTFGNPVITKNAAGRWVVLVTSGYNNVTPGDGLGHLYVLDAATGTILQNISTGVGSTTTPSGLSKITAWADNTTVDNTMLRAYGGDLLGNLWRFDPDVRIAGDTSMVTDLATLKDPTGNAQPITSKPEIGDAGTNGVVIPMVYVGTGKYLGATDVATTGVQTMYGIKDLLTTTGWGNPRANSTFVQQTFTEFTSTSGQKQRTLTSNPVNLAGVNNGWYVDLPDTGERINTDPSLDLGVLSFTSNVPNTDACTAGGYSWLNYLNFQTGSYLPSSPGNVGGIFLGNEIATRPVVVKLPSGKLISIVRGSAGDTFINGIPTGSTTSGKRVSWREILQ